MLILFPPQNKSCSVTSNVRKANEVGNKYSEPTYHIILLNKMVDNNTVIL